MQVENESSALLREVVQGVSKLASLPEVCVRVNEMVDDPRCSAADIGQVIAQDSALTAQLLRIANSAFFNFPSQVGTISRAITVIGERELRYLVLALSAVRSFGNIPIELINMAGFWRHSVYCAVVARLLAQKCHVLHSERLFVAGLLHDVGLLALVSQVPEREQLALEQAEGSDVRLAQAEVELFGFDHALVGSELLQSWGLPQILCETVASHHDVSIAEEARLDAAIVHMANIISNQAEMNMDHLPERSEYDPVALELTGLDMEALAGVAEDAAIMFAESWALIQPLVRHG